MLKKCNPETVNYFLKKYVLNNFMSENVTCSNESIQKRFLVQISLIYLRISDLIRPLAVIFGQNLEHIINLFFLSIRKLIKRFTNIITVVCIRYSLTRRTARVQSLDSNGCPHKGPICFSIYEFQKSAILSACPGLNLTIFF